MATEDEFDDVDAVELEDARKRRRAEITGQEVYNAALSQHLQNEMRQAFSEMLNRKIWLSPVDRWMLLTFQPDWRPTIGWWDDNPQLIDEETRLELFFDDFPGLREEWNARRVDGSH